jgi:hypothetical protein
MPKPKKSAASIPSLLDQIETKNPAKKSQNPQIVLEDNQAELVDEYRTVCAQIKDLEARKNSLNSEVKEIGQDLYASRAVMGQFENLKLVGNTGAVTFIVQNNFKTVSEEKKQVLEVEGLGEYIERDQIQLRDGLDAKTQERILQALAKEFGIKEALSLFETQYKVKDNALSEIASKGKKELVTSAFKLLEPVQQIRTS